MIFIQDRMDTVYKARYVDSSEMHSVQNLDALALAMQACSGHFNTNQYSV